MIKNAIIIGGSTGIGFNIAKLLSNLDYDLTLVSNNEKNLEKAKSEILKRKPETKITLFKSDLSNKSETEKLLQTIADEKKIYIFMLYCPGKAFYGNHLDTPSSIKYDIVNLHITSYMLVIDFFTKHMIKHGNQSYIVSMGSLSAIKPNPKLFLYAITKNF